jgi:hypothetical protein
MRAWLRLLKARILLLCSAGVVILGLAPLAYVVGLVAWQIHTRLETGAWIALPAALLFADRAPLPFIPHLDWTWRTHEVVARILSELHIGVIPGLVGCAVTAVGISSLLRQRILIRIQKERKKNPIQRLDDYRSEGRREPFIGDVDFSKETDRRAA